jgi:hypothetical protein
VATEKFKAMVHYIVASCDDPQRLGATRLNKICWYGDTIMYRLTGESITGEVYVKRKHGPVPKSILHALRELEKEGRISVTDQQLFQSHKIRLFIARQPANTASFRAGETDILNYVMRHICADHSAASISELSHDAIWEAANEGEEIPMFATLVAKPADWTKEVSDWAMGVISRAADARNAA